jgi:hypothetical protein
MFELLMSLVVVPFEGSFFEGSVHAFDLAVGPGMFGPSAAVFDRVLLAGISKGMNSEENRLLCFGLFLSSRFARASRSGRS